MKFFQDRYPVEQTKLAESQAGDSVKNWTGVGLGKGVDHAIKIQVIHSKTGNAQEKILTPEIASRDGVVIGRNSKCDIVLNGPEVSRLHGRIVYTGERYCFTDLGSTSGSQINNRKAPASQPVPLQSDDIIRIGKFVLLIEEFRRSRADLSKRQQSSPVAEALPLQRQRLIFKAEDLKAYGIPSQDTSEFVFQGRPLVGIFSLSKRLRQKALNLWQSELDAGRFCILVEYSNHFAIWAEKRNEK
ncbi:MAG: FHA domain-containing protein [Leptolyngbyaceae cyanobacterium RU_5_1]|nr:FHA domain-containing protein [Leptolyngbyaceae cyanobacterium RU_5_1]